MHNRKCAAALGGHPSLLGGIPVNDRVRIHALAAATLLVLGTGSPLAAGRLELSGLQSADTHQQFIVKYRDGSPARANSVALQRKLDSAASGAGAAASGLQHIRRLAVGADVVRVARKLDRAEAERLMRQLAADPDVEYVEVD